MHDEPELKLQTITMTAPATQTLIDGYAAEIAARQTQLRDDRSVYLSKLADLAQLDPLDFTGLAQLYRAHVSHIDALLKEFDSDGTASSA